MLDEIQPEGITVFSVEKAAQVSRVAARLGKTVPKGRLATDKRLRGVLAFWASYESNCITGTLIFMDAVCTLTEGNYPPRWVQDG